MLSRWRVGVVGQTSVNFSRDTTRDQFQDLQTDIYCQFISRVDDLLCAVVTLLLAVVGTFIGCIIGLIVGVIQTIPLEDNDSKVKRTLVRCLQRLLDAYVEVFRGTPMIVQAMVVYYGAMSLFDIDMSPLFAGFLVVSINTGAYMAETVRGGIESVDPGQKEAAIAIGMDHIQTMRCVILPQALRNVMPQLGNNLIINIRYSVLTLSP